ncbi:MAG: glucose-6-phosphate dehydrogenase [Terriglobales bacterium]
MNHAVSQPEVAVLTPKPRPAGPCAMVIFGATGDLTSRKLIPALYNLLKGGLVSDQFAIVGTGREEYPVEKFRSMMAERLRVFATSKLEETELEWLVSRIYYCGGSFDDPHLYDGLADTLKTVDERHKCAGNYFFYLATSPVFFGTITNRLGAIGLTNEENGHWRRVVYEKPFGTDLNSAKALNATVKKVLDEKQIYRIDHYLGKETVQNVMAFRFGNGIFEPVWNRRYVEHVQITVAETVGVERRGQYFDNAGTLRDMVPNHVMQLISLTAMEPPISFSADAVRDEQSKTVHAIQPMSSEEVLTRAIRGQYGDGVIDEQGVLAYRNEPDVAPESKTETFVALKLFIDNWRWAGVPFYVRTGKRMAARHTEIVMSFRRAPFVLFRDTPVEKLSSNYLTMHIAPDEGISLHFSAKIPGPQMRLGGVDMAFDYTDYFGTAPNTGYEVLLYDSMIGDQTLFQRADMVEAGWCVVDPIIDVWKALPPRGFPNYSAGSWGPVEADQLMEKEGRHWRNDLR